MASCFDVVLASPVSGDRSSDLEALAAHGISVHSIDVPRRTALREARRLTAAWMANQPYVMYRRHAWPQVLGAWRMLLAEFRPETVWLDHLDGFLFAQEARRAGCRTVLDLHNIYSLIPDRMAAQAINPLKRLFLHAEARRLQRIERLACETSDVIVSVSPDEAEHFRALGARTVVVAPNGIDNAMLADLPIEREASPPVVMFLGSLDWVPNVEAVLTLTNEIFPQVRQRFPDAELHIVGRNPGTNLLDMHGKNGVRVAGNVTSVRPFLAKANVFAVPLKSGGGTRLKIIEAFAAGIPVVSSSVGAEGLCASPNEEIVVAERADMADAIVKLLVDRQEAYRIAGAARRLAREKYDWQSTTSPCIESLSKVGSS